MPEQKYLVIEEAAELLRMSVRAVHERTRTRSIPMRKMNATRKILFVESELHDYSTVASWRSTSDPTAA